GGGADGDVPLHVDDAAGLARELSAAEDDEIAGAADVAELERDAAEDGRIGEVRAIEPRDRIAASVERHVLRRGDLEPPRLDRAGADIGDVALRVDNDDVAGDHVLE